jgi:soluble lytic murein transglycosylase-like protein
MSEEQDLTRPAHPDVDIRHGGDRRHNVRRTNGRAGPGRRHRNRRRRKLRSLIMAAVALAAPHQAKMRLLLPTVLLPTVAVTMNSFRALEPERAYDSLIAEAAHLYSLDQELIRAVIQAESSFDPSVVSAVGAQGLMQLMPALSASMGITDPFDPRQNIMGGARYLRELLDLHRGNVKLALASYNAGPTTVAKYKAIPPFPETQRYVKKITGLLAEARAETADLP